MNYKIKIIVPVNNTSFCGPILAAAMQVCPPDFDIDIEAISDGSSYIESRYDLAQNAPHVIELAQQVERQGYDGIFVTDMDMCGVEACREVIDIPIIGGFRASSYSAMMLGQQFSIITVENVKDLQDEHVRAFGTNLNLASIRPLDQRVPDLSNPKIIKAVEQEAYLAVTEDGADAIIFGCTGFIDVAAPVSDHLHQKLGKYIPVIDPNHAAISYLELLIRNRLSQSRSTYPNAKALHP